MSPALARHALVLLQRCDLKGAEVPVYLQVLQALQRIIEAEAELPLTSASAGNGTAESLERG